MTWVQLHLTSPPITDATAERLGAKPGAVSYGQCLLEKEGFNMGLVDGIYGLHTALAVKKAKDYKGYRKPDEVFGEQLLEILQGVKKPTVAMQIRARARAAARRRKAAATPKRAKAVNLSLTQIGIHESPAGSNRVLYSTWYGLIGPWCAMFGTWTGVQTGQRSFARGSRYAYCPYVTADAIAGRNGLSVTSSPLEGDVVIYTWGGAGSNPMGDHFGRFGRWLTPGVSFLSIEGNTSAENDPSGSQSDGGIVAQRTRYTTNVVHFIRVAE